MGYLDDLGENLVQNLQEQLDAEKLEYNKNIFLKDVILDKKYDFDLKVEEDKLTFTNFSASCFLRTLQNSPLFMILLCTAMLSIVLCAFHPDCLFIAFFVGSIVSALFFITFLKTKAYFTITPQGIEVKTNKSRVFIDRDNIADIYLDDLEMSNDRIVRSGNGRKSCRIKYSVYLKTLKPVYLTDLKKEKNIFDFFISDYNRLSKLFVVVLLNEAKRILNLPKQNEFFGNGFKNLNVLKDDGSEFVVENIDDKTKVSVNKYQIKIEENGFLGQKTDKGVLIQNTSSFRIFEDVRQKYSGNTGGIRSHQGNNFSRFTSGYSDFGLALFNDVSSKQPDVIVNYLNLDEAVYIYRKLTALR